MEFDYVIAGGGSAGSTLAARLSEDPGVRVCLVEAGGHGNGILVRMPAGAVAMLPGFVRINNWCFKTEPQAGLKGRRGYQPRGKALGGSSAINAMLYVRGHRSDYDEWADLGCEGWDWDSVLPYFVRSENNAKGANDFHGDGGPLQVSNQQSPRQAGHAFLDAAELLQYRRIADFNEGEHEGLGHYQVTQFHQKDRAGQRCSAAAAYLHPIMGKRPNLTVLTKARAERILFNGTQATGLRFRQGGKSKTVKAKREVIVCGGAFGSPQLLQLSGVGRPEEITQHGIEMVHALPGVGQNLQDHLDFTISFKSKDTDNFGIGISGAFNLTKHLYTWVTKGSGMLATPFAECGGFIKTSPALDRPDVQLHFVIAVVDDHARKLHRGYGYSCHICALRPYSKGTVFLKSADPMADPGIDPRFLSDDRDLQTMIKGARITREIFMQEPWAKYRHRELFGTDQAQSDADWAEHIRARADTIYHPVGTCKMGTDDMAVVDPELRVHGLTGLRVVDASIMPTLIGGNTNAPTIMIAEKAADLIRKDAGFALAAE